MTITIYTLLHKDKKNSQKYRILFYVKNVKKKNEIGFFTFIYVSKPIKLIII